MSFFLPILLLSQKFEKELSACLKKHEPSTFIIKPSDVSFYCKKLKKRNSAGVDGITARHFDYASALLFNHLSLLFQMSIENGVVPYQFTIGQMTPIPKKGKKDFTACNSFRPIKVSCTIFKLFESVILDETVSKCYVPPHQFGYQKGISREHVLFALMIVLADAERSRSHIILCALDLARAFDSCIFSQVLFEANKRGVNFCIVKCLLYMYHHLKAKLKGGSFLFDILKGVRQGGLTSPSLFNNSVLNAQNSVKFSCIHRGFNLSLITFADDVLNLSRTFSGCENAFNQLYNEYKNIGLSFNVEKTAVVAINFKETNGPIFYL